ncbi:MAG TPA: oligopeptide/dipeptide ABC transporter ATP-binding protein [Candidatus Limnocylindrales bacterium]|jgi:oligopeptide transport system ATP-binding protein|nr:oligopeptide/dipeptide ABC transporter ATP-binding protein [Candidatus Limnocylindrales bacterium]
MSGTDQPNLLEVNDLRVHFPIMRGVLLRRQIGAVRAVDGVSFTIHAGETLGLVGESGSGKTTTGRAVIGLTTPTEGRIVVGGRDLATLPRADRKVARRKAQMIFQNPYASLNPRMTIANIVADPLRVHGIGTERQRRERVREVLTLVGLDPRLGNRYPHQFSGGQRQRVGIARALAVGPSLIVCDEPVAALDVSIQAQIINLLIDLRTNLGLAYLFIGHDLAIVRHIADRVAVMYLGRFVELADRDSIYKKPAHPYTRALLAAVHVPDPRLERQRVSAPLTGEIPSPETPPPGCRFSTRCPLRERLGRPERCVDEEPQLREVADGQQVACHFAEQIDIVDHGSMAVSGTAA